ncbi:MAG: hypothetical protein KatS3mg114_0071 [Planctomycetaceae bacterium]|nr:MAG: hypothetical protein KatS3mg114_0071 [Planctomycetaceae bacterium]
MQKNCHPAGEDDPWSLLHQVCARLSSILQCELTLKPLTEGSTSAQPLWERRLPNIGPRPLVLTLQRIHGDRTVREVVEIGELFADFVAQYVRLCTLTREQRTILTRLADMSRELQQGTTLKAWLQIALKAAVALTQCWSAAFFLLEPSVSHVVLRGTYQISLASVPRHRRGLTPDCPDTGLLEGMNGHCFETENQPEWFPMGCQAALGVSIISQWGPIGTLWCYERRHRSFSPQQIQGLEALAAMLASHLERMLSQQQLAVHRDLQAELRLISQREAAHQACAFPTRGLEIAVSSTPAGVLSGDWCQIRPLDEQRTLIIIGDALGHSLMAAWIKSTVRGILHGLLADLSTPAVHDLAQFLQRLNHTLTHRAEEELLLTLILALIDVQQHRLTWVNAGHPSPWLWRQGDWIPLLPHGMMLGVTPSYRYQQHHFCLQPRDALLFLTDGVCDVLSANLDREELRTQLEQLPDPACHSAHTVVSALERLVAQRGQMVSRAVDDRSILFVRYNPCARHETFEHPLCLEGTEVIASPASG